jgi:hypothetical protein
MTKVEHVENFLVNELNIDKVRANQLTNQIFDIIEFGVNEVTVRNDDEK